MWFSSINAFDVAIRKALELVKTRKCGSLEFLDYREATVKIFRGGDGKLSGVYSCRNKDIVIDIIKKLKMV